MENNSTQHFSLSRELTTDRIVENDQSAVLDELAVVDSADFKIFFVIQEIDSLFNDQIFMVIKISAIFFQKQQHYIERVPTLGTI
ncbi:hypothetical protein T11_2942 [Trichinella zimbabwensis]|uniref:Uncharacterized protein n=1 Tax=Trichinella zimbabwensis TaxID=268475 RepID=A0A0V1H041_9BILA|nr:hypothetical protein T11_2942 [Trichinella zimbabwensis]